MRLPFASLGITVIICSLIFPGSGQKTSNAEHSSIVLFQGPARYEVDAKDCPVGIAFQERERFSCACVNGIWAFYDNPCLPPIAIVGGNNHCFKMPTNLISSVVVVSNPLRGLGDSLTVFEDGMESIRSKVYRNIHMTLNGVDQFVSLNSNWTLTSPDGSKSICLESSLEYPEDDEDAAPYTTYCSFAGVSKEIPVISSVKRGCNSTMVLEPASCQPILPSTSEEVCTSIEIIDAFNESAQINLDPVVAEELDSSVESTFRLSRALQNLGKFGSQRPATTTVATPTTIETTEKYASAYKGEPVWHKRWAASKDPEYFEGRALRGRAMSDSGGSDVMLGKPSTPSKPPLVTVDLNKAWTNPEVFLTAPPSSSNQLVTNHLWMYERMAIRNVLNLTRLVPPEDDTTLQVGIGKVKKLLGESTDIMKKICPLVPESYFEILTGTFLGLLKKAFRWKEPYVGLRDYLRIITSLTMCKENAVPMQFKSSESCRNKGSDFIILKDSDGAGSVTVPLEIPAVFNSDNFEPVVESVWKAFVSVHSYCFKDFSDQYQDHHLYTTLMMGLFTNELHDIWVRNKTVPLEYAGILGDISEIMLGLDRCAVGSRMTSEYPFHMPRPTKLIRYGNDLIKKRKKRDAPGTEDNNEPTNSIAFVDDPSSFSDDNPLVRKKRLTVNTIGSETLAQNIVILDGKGICLKKYSDTRTVVGNRCKRESGNKI